MFAHLLLLCEKTEYLLVFPWGSVNVGKYFFFFYIIFYFIVLIIAQLIKKNVQSFNNCCNKQIKTTTHCWPPTRTSLPPSEDTSSISTQKQKTSLTLGAHTHVFCLLNDNQVLHVTKEPVRVVWFLRRMPPGRLPQNVFQAHPAGRKPRGTGKCCLATSIQLLRGRRERMNVG